MAVDVPVPTVSEHSLLFCWEGVGRPSFGEVLLPLVQFGVSVVWFWFRFACFWLPFGVLLVHVYPFGSILRL